MFDSLCACLEQLQLSAWKRRTLPKEETYHLGGVPVEWYGCASAFDRLLKEKFVKRIDGIVCFRGDRRPPEEIFKLGFSFQGSVSNFSRLYCFNRNGSTTAGCCLASLALLTYLPNCCCGLAPYLLAAQCGCMLCSYFKPSYARYSPGVFCSMSLGDGIGVSSASVLSLAKTSQQGLRYPMGIIMDQPGKRGYLYACYIPAPYVDFDELAEKYSNKKQEIFNDGEVFSLGAPVLESKFIIGAWQQQQEEDQLSAAFLKARTLSLEPHKILPGSFKWNLESPFVKENLKLHNPNFTPKEFEKCKTEITKRYKKNS